MLRRNPIVFTLSLPLLFAATGLQAEKSFIRVSHNNGGGPYPEDVSTNGFAGTAISANGKVFAWYGLTTHQGLNVAPGGESVSWSVFTYNIETQELLPASVDETGNAVNATRPSISADGRYVAFIGTDNKRIYLRDMVGGTTTWINQTMGGGEANGNSARPLVSADGNLVAYVTAATDIMASDTNGITTDVLIYNRTTGMTEYGMLNSAGQQFSPTLNLETQYDLSPDGRYVFFSTNATGIHTDSPNDGVLFPLYRRKLSDGTVDLVSRNAAGDVASGNFGSPRSSYDGEAVAMSGQAVGVLGSLTPLINGFTHFGFEYYAKDLSMGNVWRVTTTTDNMVVNGGVAFSFDISGDGSQVVFSHSATNLDPGNNKDQNFRPDIFLAEYDGDTAATVTWISSGPSGENLTGDSTTPVFAKQADVFAFVIDDWEALLGISETNSFAQMVAYGEFGDIGGGGGTTYAAWSAGYDFGGGDGSEGGDPDGDGLSNLLEFIFDTDPTDPGARPQVTPMVVNDGNDYPGAEVIQLASPVDVTVAVEAATDPGFMNMVSVVEVLPATDLGNGKVQRLFRVESTLDVTDKVFFRLTAETEL